MLVFILILQESMIASIIVDYFDFWLKTGILHDASLATYLASHFSRDG